MSADGRGHGAFLAMIAVATAMVAGACTRGSPPAAAPSPTEAPSTTSAPTTTTTSSTTSTTSTTVRPTTTSTTVSLGPGEAFISGTVVGPAGPVDGATVRIERLVGSGVASADVTTSGGGAWRMDSVLGGAYRVRAFKPPDLVQSNVQVFFLAATERKTVDLQLASSGGERVIAIVNPNPPRVNQPAVVTIQVGTGRLDAQGRPALIPRVGAVLQLSVGAGQALESSPQALTDATGSATWRIRCLAPGPISASLTAGAGTVQVSLPPCAAAGGPAPPAATTTTRAG